MKKTLLLLCMIFSFIAAFSQKEWSNWYFSGNDLLTFKNGFPEIVHGFVQPQPTQYDPYNYYYWGIFPESVCYSDPGTGNMRFLVYNKMVYGSDFKAFPAIRSQLLSACEEDANAYHIIPFHNNPDKFYIIQFQDCIGDLLAQQTGLQVKCPNSYGLAYSIVDMRLNGGLGDISSINQQITTNLSAQITTVKHANGKDVWVIVHPANSNTFSARLITDNGIGAPVNTSIGPVITGSYTNYAGNLTASRDGKMLAGYSAAANSIQLFDFDNTSGILSNYRTLPFQGYVLSMQFSPDDSKLYYSGYSSLYQYDLSQPDIGNSLTKIASNDGNMRSMQLAADGKIYISRLNFADGNTSRDYTGIIICPNLPQYACNFDPKGLPVGAMNYMTLINDLVVDPKAPQVTRFSLGNDTTLCSGSYTLKAPPGWETYKWNTGEISQNLTVSQPGLYYVLTGKTGFNCPTGYGYINILPKGKGLDLGPDTSICKSSPYQIHIDSNFSNIVWENGSNTRDSLITIANLYKVTATGKDGCPSTDSIMVKINSDAQAGFGNDTALCAGSTLTLRLLPAASASPAPKYTWQDGSSLETYTVNKTGKYWGTVNFAGCIATDTILVNYMNVLSASLGPDTSFCTGDSLILSTPVSNASYLWNTGATTQRITVKTAGLYSIKVNNGTCDYYDSVLVNTATRPVFSLGADTSICADQPLVLNPHLQNGNYLWQDGSANQQYAVKAPGLFWLQFSQNGCSSRDTVLVDFKKVPPLALGNDTSLCEGNTILLNAATPAIASYLWQDGSTNSSYRVKTSGLYTVLVKGINGCTNKEDVNIMFTALPVVEITGDSVLCGDKPLILSGKVKNANTFSWQTGSTASQLSVANAGAYTLTATNTCGVVAITKTVGKSICSLLMPTAFTPNGDREDDLFRVKYPFETKQFLFTIYNRWGQQVFLTTDIKKGWDGSFHGQLQSIGNYVWIISLTDTDNHFQQIHGTVLLIR